MERDELRKIGETIISRVENDEHRTRLEGMVIDPSYADEDYFPRVLPGKRTEVDLYLRSMNTGQSPMLMGPAGSGKTSSPFYFASLTGMPLAIVKGHNGFDPTSFLAEREQDPVTGHWYWRISDFGLVCIYSGCGVVDELYRIPAKSSGVMFDLYDSRKRVEIPGIGTVRLADDLLLVATTNPPSYAGVGEIDMALNDRFSPVLEWDYDPVVEAKLVNSKHLLTMATEIRRRGDIDGEMSTRTLIEFQDLAIDLGFDMAVAGMLGRFNEFEKGIIGPIVANWGPKIRNELGV
jgi:MoxR-like ATPase